MEKELDHLRKEVARMSKSPEISGQDGLISPLISPAGPVGESPNLGASSMTTALDLGPPAEAETPLVEAEDGGLHKRAKSVESIPLLDAERTVSGDNEIKRTLDGGVAPVGDMTGGSDKKNE